MRKVLIILYYWPPAGGSGVRRWLKFAKYLPEFNWEPVIYAPENPEYPEIDDTLVREIPEGLKVIKYKITEPYDFYRKFAGLKNKEKVGAGMTFDRKTTGASSLKSKFSMWIRGNLFIPDARMFWIRPSVKFLVEYIKSHPVDLIITSGPPHSLHLIGYHLKEKTGLPWIADFRDPWTSIDFYSRLKLTKCADRKHHRLEKKVLRNADYVITVAKQMKEEFKKSGAERVEVITNGYDESLILNETPSQDKKFSLLHVGTVGPARSSGVLWNVLSELNLEKPEFAKDLEIKLIGKVDHNVLSMINKAGLTENLNHIDFLPHDKVALHEMSAQILLLLINQTENSKGILTGKLFEYLASQRPILGIGPEDGEAAEILRETRSGSICGFEDHEKLKAMILHYYDLYKKNELMVASSGIEKYSRVSLTRDLVSVMDEAVKK